MTRGGPVRENLKAARKGKGMTQKQVADALASYTENMRLMLHYQQEAYFSMVQVLETLLAMTKDG